jgi:hypothetical protein
MRLIREAAELAVNNYNNYTDEKLHNIPYFYAFFSDEGACACHCEWDFGDATGRYLDALILCNEMLGIKEITPRERDFYESLLWMISFGDDRGNKGLAHRPTGLEWVTPCVNTFDQRSALMGLVSYYKKSQDAAVLEVARSMVRGLIAAGAEIDDYFYLPFSDMYPDTVIEQKPYDIKTNKADPCHYGGGVHLVPLMMLYDVTHDADLLELCRKIINFIKISGTFDVDGGFFSTGFFAGEDGHFHSRMSTVLGMMMYALETDDGETAGYCEMIYKFAKTQGTSYGFFPEGLGNRPVNGTSDEYPDVARHTEICGTADMIHTAILLSKFGKSNYYDDAARFANHLIASQLTDISWIVPSEEKPDESHCTHRDVAARYRGNFTGRTLANDMLNNGRYDNMGCCSAAGGRALWTLWRYAAEFADGETTVELWLDCDNDVCKIETDGRGKITVTPKNSGNVRVRIPDFVKLGDNADDGYITLRDVRAGECVTIDGKIEREVKRETLCGETLTVTWLGSEVTDVMPRGKDMVLYPHSVN